VAQPGRRSLAAGARLGGRYRLEERIGVGGMGEVWRAVDEVLGRTVAVKVMLAGLLDEPGFVSRFLVEARAMASLNHPGVVAIHDYSSDANEAFLVMEYIEGEALSRTLARLGRLAPTATMDLVGQAAEALAAAHDRGIVHRDVKPANLLLRPDGTVVLTDFGIARAQAGTALTTAGAILGTPSYLAPEQVLGQPATARSDVYALGVVAYECLAGRRPFEAESPFAVAMRRVREPPPQLGAEVPQAVRAVVARAIATDPDRRWPSAADLAAAARAAIAGRPIRPRSRPAAVRTAPGVRRRWLAAAVALVLGVALVGVGIWAGTRSTPGQDRTQAVDTTRAATPRATTPGAATTGTRSGPAPTGLVRCGGVWCPSAPMCWGGLISQLGAALPPRRVDCAEPHDWETFVVANLPPDAVSVRQDELIARTDISGVCSEAAMAERSRDPSLTTGWRRDAWPVRAEGQDWIFHCMASTGEGETAGSVFRGGA